MIHEQNRAANAEWPAPAKINLYLHVRGRRADGMHELETEFQFLDFADTLKFNTNAPRIRRIDRHDFALPGEDLIVRAAKLLQSASGVANGASITLRKVIPPGSGLGGGSSNAATTLLALNYLWNINMPRAQLEKLALQLGADVPVFVRGHAAVARGVGEVLEQSSPPQTWFCVFLTPPCVSTARVFAELQSTHSANAPRKNHGNDLETAAAKLYPEIANTLARIREKNFDARLSGSGGAVYIAFDSRDKAKRAAEIFSGIKCKCVIAQSQNIHPLQNC